MIIWTERQWNEMPYGSAYAPLQEHLAPGIYLWEHPDGMRAIGSEEEIEAHAEEWNYPGWERVDRREKDA